MSATKQYLIMSTSELARINFNEIHETDVTSLRRSIDGSKALIEWSGNTPAFVGTLIIQSSIYTISEIKIILSSSEWVEPFSV